MAVPLGVAKNTTSQSDSAPVPGSENARSTTPRSDGNIPDTGLPRSVRDVTASSSTSGCPDRQRISSTPV